MFNAVKQRGWVYTVLLAGVQCMPSASFAQQGPSSAVSLVPPQILEAPSALQVKGIRDLVLLVLNRHPDFKKSEFEGYQLMARVGEARAARLPNLVITGSVGQESQKIKETQRTNSFDQQYRLQARLTQPLVDESIVERVRQSRALALAQDWETVSVREQIMLSTVELYAELNREFHLTQLARDNLKLHRTYVAQMKDLARTDIGRASDLPVAQSRVALAESVYTNRLARLEAARVKWRNLSGLPAPEIAVNGGIDWLMRDLAVVSMPNSADEALKDAFENSPQLQKALADVRASGHALSLSRTATLPRVSAEVRTETGNDFSGVQGGQDTWFAGVNFQWNLPVNPGYSYGNRAARQSMKAAESAVDSAIFKVRAAVETQWYDLLASQAALTAYQSYVGSAEKVVEAYDAQFKIGRRSLLDVLNAENELFTARSNVATTQVDLTLASWRLLSLRGLMVYELGL
jgi:outer membrane protein, adhesin transport system